MNLYFIPVLFLIIMHLNLYINYYLMYLYFSFFFLVLFIIIVYIIIICLYAYNDVFNLQPRLGSTLPSPFYFSAFINTSLQSMHITLISFVARKLFPHEGHLYFLVLHFGFLGCILFCQFHHSHCHFPVKPLCL